MKFGMIKPAGSAKYAHEKVVIFRISLFLSIISNFYQICFLKNIRTSMGLITNFIRESCITVVNKLYNVQETTFFRSFLTTFFLPQTLFGGGTERSPR